MRGVLLYTELLRGLKYVIAKPILSLTIRPLQRPSRCPCPRGTQDLPSFSVHRITDDAILILYLLLIQYKRLLLGEWCTVSESLTSSAVNCLKQS